MGLNSRVRLERGDTYDYAGTIVGEGSDPLGDFWVVRIDLTHEWFYGKGVYDHISKGSNWLKEII